MISADLVERFRATSLDRVGRVEGAWNRLVAVGADGDPGQIQHMLREVHTLKGDSAVAGARHVQRLCEKLEDLLQAVDEPPVDISDDLDVVVTMAIQFLGMLLRARQGAVSGIDLEGFVRQVDDVLRETRVLPISQRRIKRTTLRDAAETPIDRLSDPTRQRFAVAATTVFLEYLAARGTVSRARLRGAWSTLRDELGKAHAAELAPLFERHAGSALELAHRLGKLIAIDLALADVRIEPRVAEAVDIAVLHIIRNAIDHGIELPPARVRAGKPEQGTVRVRAASREGSVEITIEDDGGGIDFAAIRRIAVGNGLLDPASASDEAALLELIYAPGFSTKSNVTELSGRGVGMDAVKSAIARVGGQIRIATTARGTAVTVTVPAVVRHLHAYQFLAPSGSVSLAVSARWTPSIDPSPNDDAVDPLAAIQLSVGGKQTNVEPPEAGRALSLRLRWGFLETSLRAATEPRLVTAERICSTPDDHAVEVVTVEGQETLLLRPEHVAELAVARGARNAVGR